MFSTLLYASLSSQQWILFPVHWKKTSCRGGYISCISQGAVQNYSDSKKIICCCSVTQSCLTLGDPMDCNAPGFLVLHHLPQFVQSHVHWIGDAIQPSHPLSSPSPPAFDLSQHQGLFQWVSSLHQVAKVLEIQLHHQSFQWIFRTDFLEDWLVWSLCSPRDSQESSPIPQFKSINSSAVSFLYGPTLIFIHDHWENHSLN